MKKTVGLFTFLLIITLGASAQRGSLYDDSRVSTISIQIDPDSLALIMTDVLSDHYFLAQFIFSDGTVSDTLERIGLRLRGNTSRYSKKKSFKISFNEYDSTRKYQNVKKLNLNGQHNDPTMIREKLYYDLWKKAGMVERRSAFVRLYINNIYYGLYTNIEEMDKSWLKRNFPDKDGNLYKCTYPADLTYHGLNQQYYKNIPSGSVTGGRAYDLQTNETADDYTRLVALIEQLTHAPNDAFISDIKKILDVDHFLKALAFDVATGNWDDYAYNKNNYFLYDRPDNKLFEFVSYDTDNTFGVDWVGQDWATRNCLAWPNENMDLPLAEKLLAVPLFFRRYQGYLDSVVTYITEPDSVFPYIDHLKNLITPAAITDLFRTLDYGYTMNDFNDGFIKTVDGHTPYGIKPFLTKRKQYIKQQVYPAGIDPEAGQSVSWNLYPNPVQDWLTISGFSGSDPLKLEVMDYSGNTIMAREITPATGGLYRFDASDLIPGFYVLRISDVRTIYTGKFIRQ